MRFKRCDFIDISGVIFSNELDFSIIEMKIFFPPAEQCNGQKMFEIKR